LRLTGEYDGATYTLRDQQGSIYTFQPGGSATFVGGSGQMYGEFFARFRGPAEAPAPVSPSDRTTPSPNPKWVPLEQAPLSRPPPPRNEALLAALSKARTTIEQRLPTIP